MKPTSVFIRMESREVILPGVERGVYWGGGGEGGRAGQRWAEEMLAGGSHTLAALALPLEYSLANAILERGRV